VAAVEDCSALNCLPGASESRWVWGWPRWSEVAWCYCATKGCSVRVQMSKAVPEPDLPEGFTSMQKGYYWVRPGVHVHHSPPWRRRWEQDKLVTMLLQTVVFVYIIWKSTTTAPYWCSPSGLPSITNCWNV